MNYLALDTSSYYMTVVLSINGKKDIVYEREANLSHSVLLMPKIEELLKRNNARLKDLDCYGVCVGAGSFTGIRIGISTVKGFCDCFKKPAFTFSAFDISYYGANLKGKVLSCLDAKHSHYYVAGYESGKMILSPEFIDEEKLKELAKDYRIASPDELNILSVKTDPAKGLIAAAEKMCENLIDSDDIVPLYIRKSQAEEHR